MLILGCGSRGDGKRDIQSYSKYSRQPRVRAASDGAPDGLHRHALLIDAASGSVSQHALPDAAEDRQRNNRIV